jgi:predicted transcriptional regulator
MREAGATNEEIAVAVGASPRTIFRRLGGTRPRQKASNADIARMREMRALGSTLDEIGREVGLSGASVRRYVGGRTNAERLDDHIGKVYGHLTVIGIESSDKVNLRCICGNEVIKTLRDVRRSVTASCGCVPTDFGAKTREDMTGQTHHGFTGVRFVRAGSRAGNGPVWEVKCAAGHVSETSKKTWKKGEIRCAECASLRRVEADRARRLRQARQRLEAEQRLADRAAKRLAGEILRELDRKMRPLREYVRRHEHCYGKHSLGLYRTVTCEEYEAERRRQSLTQGGNGLNDRRGRRVRNFDFPPRIRTEILKRDGFSCLRCGRHARDLANGDRLEVDHVFRGRGRAVYDGQTLCTPCHTWKHKTSDRDGLSFLPEDVA